MEEACLSRAEGSALMQACLAFSIGTTGPAQNLPRGFARRSRCAITLPEHPIPHLYRRARSIQMLTQDVSVTPDDPPSPTHLNDPSASCPDC